VFDSGNYAIFADAKYGKPLDTGWAACAGVLQATSLPRHLALNKVLWLTWDRRYALCQFAHNAAAARHEPVL